jgi:ketosteroid isomerase-like protein
LTLGTPKPGATELKRRPAEKEDSMKADSASTEEDKKILLSIVKDMSKSMTGAQSTKHWADGALWFDVVPFASKGIKLACRQFDSEFAKVKSFDVHILETEVFINGDMGVVCGVQRWNIVGKDGTVKPPMLIRQTDCFERQRGQWRIVHEHLSAPISPGWNGKIEEGE